MSRVLLDDRFCTHPKIRALTDRQFRVWVRLLCECASVEDASVDIGLLHEIPGFTGGMVKTFVRLHLLDEEVGGWRVHNFAIYNGATVDDRVAAYLRGHPEASANEVARAVPVRRGLVLEAVRRYRNGNQ